MTAVPNAEPALRVLHALAPPDGSTQFVDLMVDGAHPQVRILFFSWRTAITGSYDVLHVHWPERLIRDRRRMRGFAKRRALDLLLVRARLNRIAVVWTAHNLEPHESGPPSERRSLARFLRAVTLVVRLNPTTATPPGVPVATIPHAHYRTHLGVFELPEPEPGRLLYFGIIRPYKGVDTLIDAFSELPADEAALRIVGDPHPGQRELVESATADDTRISALLRFVTDAELVNEVGRCQLVVLPYRERMHNSGVLLVALSLGRPVLVPASPANAALRDEVGDGWILEYDGELTAASLGAALDAAAAPRPAAPDLSSRDLDAVGSAHFAAYRAAVDRVGGRA